MCGIVNGERYNYQELIKSENLICKTKSDTEVIIRLYKKFRINFLNKLNGMFSFCIDDKNVDYSYLNKYKANNLSYIKIWIAEVLISKIDRMPMAHSLELRTPFIEWLYDSYKDEVLSTILRINKKLNIFNEEYVKFLYNEAKQKDINSIYGTCLYFQDGLQRYIYDKNE